MMLAVTSNGWLLALHLLAAFTVVASLILVLIVVVAGRRLTSPDRVLALGRLTDAGWVLLRGGLAVTLVFGIWLVFAINGYSAGQAWIIAAIGLWIAIGAVSGWGVREHRAAESIAGGMAAGDAGGGGELARALASPLMLALAVGGVLAGLVTIAVMIWKPGV